MIQKKISLRAEFFARLQDLLHSSHTSPCFSSDVPDSEEAATDFSVWELYFPFWYFSNLQTDYNPVYFLLYGESFLVGNRMRFREMDLSLIFAFECL